MKKLKRLLFIMFLCPLIPLIGLPDDDNPGTEGDNNNNNDDDQQNFNDNNKNESTKITFDSQEAFDKVINRRIAKAVKSTEEKFKKQQEDNNLSENQKLQKEIDDMKKANETRTQKVNEKLIRAAVISKASKLGIVDGEAAYLLMNREDVGIDENDKVFGVGQSLEKLLTEKPYLKNKSKDPLRAGDDQSNNSGTTTKQPFNTMIRNFIGANNKE